VLTDIANEPDDQMSMVRFLVYSNQFDVEGLVACTSTWMRDRVRPDVILSVIDAYAHVRDMLARHEDGFPDADTLRAVVTSGQPGYGMAAVGPDRMSPGAALILKAADRPDPRPLWIPVWGGANTLALESDTPPALGFPIELHASGAAGPAAGALLLSSQVAAAITCARTLTADVVAFDQPIMFNRLGAANVNGMMYALRRDVVNKSTLAPLTVTPAGAVAGQVMLRPDKRTRPLILRVAAGAVAIDVPISQWLLICTILLALFLGLSKRRHEIVLLADGATEHRPILQEYSPYLLDQMIGVVTASTLMAYILYATSHETADRFGTSLLGLTIPFPLYGIFRYLYLVHRKEGGGSPAELLLNDRPLLACVALWAVAVAVIIYRPFGI